MNTVIEQYKRVKRYLNRLEHQDRDSTEYDDDLWAFFQNCYHLKDWIKNDPSVRADIASKVEGFVNNNLELRICSDLANRIKHLSLDRVREEAEVTNRNVNIEVPLVGSDILGTSTCEHVITLGDGSKHIALDVARKAVENWTRFLSDKELLTS